MLHGAGIPNQMAQSLQVTIGRTGFDFNGFGARFDGVDGAGCGRAAGAL